MKITPNDVVQLFNIGLSIGVICFCGYKIEQMKYPFWKIFTFTIWYPVKRVYSGEWDPRLLKPIDFMVTNVAYLFFAILFVGQMSSIFGLLRQFRLNQVGDKPWEWVVSGPLSKIGVLGICLFYEPIFKETPIYQWYKRHRLKVFGRHR